jgi:hypothetical protein
VIAETVLPVSTACHHQLQTVLLRNQQRVYSLPLTVLKATIVLPVLTLINLQLPALLVKDVLQVQLSQQIVFLVLINLVQSKDPSSNFPLAGSVQVSLLLSQPVD